VNNHKKAVTDEFLTKGAENIPSRGKGGEGGGGALAEMAIVGNKAKSPWTTRKAKNIQP